MFNVLSRRNIMTSRLDTGREEVLSLSSLVKSGDQKAIRILRQDNKVEQIKRRQGKVVVA
jgi:hypothetical protein